MWKKIRPMLPHAAILFANAYVVFFLIDRVNTAMNFIDNGLTKGMLLVMCLLAIANWRISKARARRGKGSATRMAPAAPAPQRPAANRPKATSGAGKHLAKGNPAGGSGA